MPLLRHLSRGLRRLGVMGGKDNDSQELEPAKIASLSGFISRKGSDTKKAMYPCDFRNLVN